MAEDYYNPPALAPFPVTGKHFRANTVVLSLLSLGAEEMFCSPSPGALALLGSTHCCSWWSYLAESHLLGFVFEEKIHQLVQVILTVDLEGLGSRGTTLTSLKDRRSSERGWSSGKAE